MSMWEEASKTFFLGVQVYSFGLYTALGLALALILLAMQLKKAGWKPGTAALTGVLSIVLGLAVSRLMYGCMDVILGRIMPLWAMLRLTDGGYSMMGALLGACMGAILAARWTRQNAARLLDFLAPSFLLFVACQRLGEGYIEDYGISRALQYDLFKGSFLAVEVSSDWCLATYLIESFLALVLCLVLIRDVKNSRRSGNAFLLFMLLFGGTQVLMESLCHDGHMTINSFVRVEQIIAMMLLCFAVIVLAKRQWKKHRTLALVSLLLIPVVTAAGVGIEFMIDRTNISRYLLYLAFIALIAVPAGLGIRLRREE